MVALGAAICIRCRLQWGIWPRPVPGRAVAMATTRQCTKVKGELLKCFRVSVANWAATEENGGAGIYATTYV